MYCMPIKVNVRHWPLMYVLVCNGQGMRWMALGRVHWVRHISASAGADGVFQILARSITASSN